MNLESSFRSNALLSGEQEINFFKRKLLSLRIEESNYLLV